MGQDLTDLTTRQVLPSPEPAAGARIVYGLRIENSGPEAVNNMVVRVTLPKYVSVVPGSCRYGFDQVAATPCPGAPVAEGAQFPQLEPGGWLHLVVSAEVSAEAPGGRYLATLAVASDQTNEIRHRIEVRIPASPAEEAVRDLYQATEDECQRLLGRRADDGAAFQALLD